MAGTAPDGSPVDLYALLPDRGEGELVAQAMPAGAAILELGSGAGRMTRQLVARGFAVTAVDESAEMLACVHGAEPVQASIEELDLGRRFDAVLLASNLLTAEPAQRRAFLETCRKHADVTIVETLPLGWRPPAGDRTIGEVTARMLVDRFEDGVVEGTMEYESGRLSWSHEFAMRVFSDGRELTDALGEAGWALDRWLDHDRGWFVARPVEARSRSV